MLRGPPVSFLPGHITFVASDTQVTFSIFYLWGVALLDRFLSTGLDETCLGRNLAGPGYLPGWEVREGTPEPYEGSGMLGSFGPQPSSSLATEPGRGVSAVWTAPCQ